MSKANCWEFKNCGRQIGGGKVPELGVCPAATNVSGEGTNGGRNNGRICWAVAGTFCDGDVQGTFATKRPTCAGCDFFKLVQREEGTCFALLRPDQTTNHALRENFTSIVSIIDSMSAIVYVADLDTHELLFLNPYAATLFGEDCIGKRCYQVLQVGQATACSFCTNQRLVVDGQAGPPVVWEFQNTVTGRWFLCIDKAIPWWDGRLVRMEVAIDITDRKAAERFRDEYIDLISHDLRNPLNAVMLRAQALQRTLQKKGLEQESADLEKLLTSAKQMNALIGDLVETTRLETGRLELRKAVVDVGDRVAQVVARIPSPPERCRIEFPPQDRPVSVLADAVRLDRVIENLISNALKYSREEPVRVALSRRGNEAVVSVSDRGVGVAAADLPRLFQRFYRGSTVGSRDGLGLGLYNARLIVEAHGGRIWAESEVGQGACFYFALPLAPERSDGPTAEPARL